MDLKQARVSMGGHVLFENGAFILNRALEAKLRSYLEATELYRSAATTDGLFHPPVAYPPHERCVDIEVAWPSGRGDDVVVIGADLSHEYITENADYRS